METLDIFLPEIALRASRWVERRFGRMAGWAVFLGLLIGLPVALIAYVVLYAVGG